MVDSLLARTERFLGQLMSDAESDKGAEGQCDSEGREVWLIADKLKLAATVTQFLTAKERLEPPAPPKSEFNALKQQLNAGGRKARDRGDNESTEAVN